MSKPRELFIRQDDLDDRGIVGCCVYVSRQLSDDLAFREVTPESEAELAELRKDYAELLEVKERLAIRLHSELSTLTAKVKRYEEVLLFYANGGNPSRDIWFDERLGYFTGKRARAALNESEKK